MNKNSTIDLIGVTIIKFLSVACCCFPLRPALWIGRRLGNIALIVNSKRRAIAYANLKSAFPEKKTGEIKKILKSHYESLGMNIVELLKLPVLKKSYLRKYIKLLDFDKIERSLEKGKGVILLAAHFGNWEITSLAVNSRGHSVSVFARDQKYRRLNDLLNKYREMTGCKIIAKGFAVREIIKALKNNKIVGMLVDQDAGANGIFVNFMHRPASTAQGAVSFALKTGADIITCFIRRQADFSKHIVDIGGPLELVNTGERERDIKKNLDKITDVMEDYIRKYPDQWLWPHKRWKSSPHRTVLVLNDGKAGHLNQAKAVAEMIEGALGSRLEIRGIEEKPIVKIKIIEVKFKNRFARIISDINSIFSGKHCQGCLRCLKFCLKKETFSEIKNQYADIIISCGASTVGANIVLKNENNAKSIVIMKPGLGRARKFDLILLPAHDAPARLKSNMLITEISPNRILPRASSLERKIRGIGLLIGGDAKNFKLEREVVEKTIDGVIKISEEMGYDIFASTSRRTVSEVDSLLKDKLKNNKRCRLLVIANEKNIEGAAQRILDESEIVLVSPESVSMISEAVSARKHVVVFGLKARGSKLKGKYGRNLANLEKQGYIKTAEGDKIYSTIKQILEENPVIKEPGDKKNITQRLQALM